MTIDEIVAFRDRIIEKTGSHEKLMCPHLWNGHGQTSGEYCYGVELCLDCAAHVEIELKDQCRWSLID